MPHDEPAFTETIDLRPDLENSIHEQFDRLLKEGELIWKPHTSELVHRDGVKVVFQMCPHIMVKPLQEKHDEVRKTGKGGKNPFLNPDPNFIICHVGPLHTLIHNKYCVYKNHIILHTKEFASQEDPLDLNDIHAAWTLIKHFKQQEYMMIYNCGFDSGSSQGHKHMQLWPYLESVRLEDLESGSGSGSGSEPEEKEKFDIFPSQVVSQTEIATELPNTPIRHFALRLPRDATSRDVFGAQRRLLVEVDKCHRTYGSTSHNVALTKDWICLIPRRSNGLDRKAGSNAAGALGLVWIGSEEERTIWSTPTLASHLCHIGVPLDKYTNNIGES